MDWTDPVTFSHFYRNVRGLTYHFVDEKPTLPSKKENGTIVLLHGFPDLWYGWRRVIPMLTQQGFRVIAPDLRGFGQTEAPAKTSEYALAQSAADIIALLQALSIHQAYFLGHDWGGEVAYRIALKYPHYTRGIISVCTPFTPAGSNFVRLEHVVKRWPSLRYQLYFIQGDEAEKEFNSNVSG